MRLLLSGTGTPMQPISKFVQIAISHLTGNLLYQFIDRHKRLTQSTKRIHHSRTLLALPCVMLCLSILTLTTRWKLPAMERLLKFRTTRIRNSRRGVSFRHLTSLSTPMHVSTRIWMAGRCLPSLITVPYCDSVDIFMGELDREPVSRCPVSLLLSRAPQRCKEELLYFDLCIFRDDGITILPKAGYLCF